MELIDNITDTYYTKNVSQWDEVIDKADYEKDMNKLFGAITTNIVNLMFPNNVTKVLISNVAYILGGKDTQEFLVNEYLPLLQEATKDVAIPLGKKVRFVTMGVGVVVKLVYAFTY